jgi:NAD(P)H-hydrate epimerase
MRVISQERVAAVVDADGLTALATMPEANRDMRAAAVLTPHPGEFRTLAGAFVLEGDAAGDAEERELAAKSLARRFGCVVVLKGDDTVVTDGVRSWRLSEASVAGGVLVANPLLATGGSGDVLTGMVAGVIAQHVKPALLAGEHSMPSEQLGGISLFDAARAAVTAHAIAGRAARERDGRTGGLLARELADLAPVGIEALRMTSGTARAAGGR